MATRTLAGPQPKIIEFPLVKSSCPVSSYRAGVTVTRRTEKVLATDEDIRMTGCLRGLCWGLLMECTVAFLAYEAWHLWHFVR